MILPPSWRIPINAPLHFLAFFDTLIAISGILIALKKWKKDKTRATLVLYGRYCALRSEAQAPSRLGNSDSIPHRYRPNLFRDTWEQVSLVFSIPLLS